MDLDTFARVHGMANPDNRLPCLILWDMAAASPSVSHDWLFLVLEHLQVPRGFPNLVKALYRDCFASTRWGSISSLLFKIYSGVLQGCPLSAMVFTLAVNPFFA